MVFLSGHGPGATESHRICQAWFLSATLQLEMGHMMMLTHRWLPAAWEGLNDALPKCRELRKGKLKPDVAASPSTILDQLETHLEHLTPWVQGTGPDTYKALESCLCHKQKRSTKNSGDLKRLWKVLHTLRDHHTIVLQSGPLVCYNTLLEESCTITLTLFPLMLHARGKPAKSILRLEIFLNRESNQYYYDQTAKG